MTAMPDAMSPVDYVKKVGKGKTLSADLAPGEARAAFDLLLDGGFLPVQLGAFLQALRIKELTQEELDALAAVFRARMTVLPPLAGAHTLVLNLASDTQRKGGLASLLSAFLLPRFGIGVGIVRSEPVLQGNHASFDTSLELARRLSAGLPAPAAGEPAALPDQAGASAPEPVIADCSGLIRGLAALDLLRGQLGFRSCLHTAEKLVNPWPASPVLLGISHKHYALRMAATLAAQGGRGRILLGNHGTVDLVLHKDTELVAVDGGIREEAFGPAALGLEVPSDVYSLGKFPQWREWVDAMISGTTGSAGPEGRDNGLRRAVQFHLASLLWMAGAAPDAASGLALARRGLPRFFT